MGDHERYAQKNRNSLLHREVRYGANARFDGVCIGQPARILPANWMAICRLGLVAVLVMLYLTWLLERQPRPYDIKSV